MARSLLVVVIVVAACGDNHAAGGDGSIADAPVEDAPIADAPTDAGVGHIVGDAHDFGLVQVAKISAATVTLTNPTPYDASIDAIAVTGAGFSRGATTCGATLAAGQSCDVTVNAVPFHLGTFSGQLVVATSGGQTMLALSANAGGKLAVRLAGTGTGQVTSNADIDCGSTCTTLQTTTIMLTAAPTGSSRFAGWSGAPGCGAMPVCIIDAQIAPRDVAAVFLLPGDFALNVVMAGSAPSEVQIATVSTNDGCIENCVVAIPAGAQVDISAASPSTYVGLSGACTTTQHGCSVTLAADATLTITSNREPNETFSRFVQLGGTVSFGTDAQGNIVLGGPVKLDPAGNVLWALPLGGVVAVASDGHVAVWGGTTLYRLRADGTTEWSADLGETFGDLDIERKPLAISSNGDLIVVRLQASIRVYAGDGTLRWSVAPPLATYGVAVDQQGNVTFVTDLADNLGERRALLRYAPDRTQLTLVDNIASLDGYVEFDLDASGAPVATVIDQQFRYLERRRLDGTLVFYLSFTDPRAFSEGSSVVVASDDTLWWGYDPHGNAAEYALEHRSADGTLLSGLTRGNLPKIGPLVGPYIYAMHAGGTAGSVIVGGIYQGYFNNYEFLQGFTP